MHAKMKRQKMGAILIILIAVIVLLLMVVDQLNAQLR